MSQCTADLQPENSCIGFNKTGRGRGSAEAVFHPFPMLVALSLRACRSTRFQRGGNRADQWSWARYPSVVRHRPMTPYRCRIGRIGGGGVVVAVLGSASCSACSGSIRPEPKLSLRSPAPGGTACATAANETLAIAKAAAMTRALASMLLDLSTNGRQNFTSGAYAEAIVAAGCQPPAFGNFSRCFNKVTPRNGFGAFRPRIGSRKAIRGRFDPRRHASQ